MDMHPYLSATGTISSKIIPTPFQPKHAHGIPILQRMGLTPGEKLYWENYNTTTFFNTTLGKPSALKCHITTLLLSFLLVYPICLVFDNYNKNWYFMFLSVNQILFSISYISLFVYVSTFPNSDIWYPHNIYFKVFTILFIITTLYFVFYCYLHNSKISIPHKRNEYMAMECMSPGSEHLQTNNGNSSEEDLYTLTPSENQSYEEIDIMTSNNKYNFNLTNTNTNLFVKFMYYFVKIFNILLLFFMAIDVFIGLAIGCLFGKEERIFNLLAHWIKGGVFVILGVISVGRYCGNGKTYGWAWNSIAFTRKQLKEDSAWGNLTPQGTITMETVEAGLILFYGCTNVFLEHLAGAGGAWTAKDLQHASIAFMYIGTGLCGVLIEAQTNKWRYEKAKELLNENNHQDEEIVCASPGYSPNPFPALTIFWTGILMSQHAQPSELSTKVHSQWGYLFSYGSLFRILTYIIFYLKPVKNQRPTRPITELITSFCLISGGVIFMESTDQVIEAMEYRGFTPMFTLNVSVGISTLFIGWLMILFMWKQKLNDRQLN